MDRYKEHHGDGNAAVKDKDNRELIQNHTKQAGGEGNHNQRKQQQALCAQLFAVDNGMDDAQQQKKDGSHLVSVHTGQRHHNRHNETDQQCEIE